MDDLCFPHSSAGGRGQGGLAWGLRFHFRYKNEPWTGVCWRIKYGCAVSLGGQRGWITVTHSIVFTEAFLGELKNLFPVVCALRSKNVCVFVSECSCVCPPGFEGQSCEINPDDCEDNDCENNSTCIDGVNNYTCVCPPNYTGTFTRQLLLQSDVP